MDKFLDDYIERIRSEFPQIPEDAGHVIASAFFAYRYELFPKTVRECTTALSQLSGSGIMDAVKKALILLRSYAQAYDNSQVRPDPVPFFTETEQQYLAVVLLKESVEDPDSLALDNALVLIYAVSLAASPDDEDALLEHRKFILILLEAYKRQLGLQ